MQVTLEAGLVTVRSPLATTDGDSIVKVRELAGFTVVAVDRSPTGPGLAAGVDPALNPPSDPLPSSFKLVNNTYGQRGTLLCVTQVFALPSHLQIARDYEDLVSTSSISLIQQSGYAVDPADGAPDLPVRLFVRSYRQADGQSLVDVSQTAESVAALRRDHPTLFGKWVVPILVDLRIPHLATEDPTAAWQVLAADAVAAATRADPMYPTRTKQDLTRLIAELDAPRFADRQRAQHELEHLSPSAASLLAQADRASWSAEQSSSVDAFFAARWPLAADKANQLYADADFLLDTLYNRDAELVTLASARLALVLQTPVPPIPPNTVPADRASVIEPIRARLRQPAVTQSVTRPAPVGVPQ